MREQSLVNGPQAWNFTEALANAVLLTKDARWVKNGKVLSQTSVWDKWLIEVERLSNTAGEHIGKLKDPVWPGKFNGGKGVIWDIPPDWNPKPLWDNIHAAEQKQGVSGD